MLPEARSAYCILLLGSEFAIKLNLASSVCSTVVTMLQPDSCVPSRAQIVVRRRGNGTKRLIRLFFLLIVLAWSQPYGSI